MRREARPGHRRVRIWDLPTRLFHWVLAAVVAVAAVTGLVTPEWWMGAHVWAGYVLVLLLVFRVAWGFWGSEHSRFDGFAHAPAEVWRHLSGLVRLKPPHYLGHNPAGAMMIFALLIMLSAMVLTGLLVLGGEENQGPLQDLASYRVAEVAKWLHGALFNLLLLMIGAHLLGVLVESLLWRENLVRTMVTGDKMVARDTELPAPRRARPVVALGAVAVVFGVFAGVFSMLDDNVGTDPRKLTPNPDYASECGECHEPFHPGLLPAASWRRVMAGLDDHFGEDASLDAETAGRISAWLGANAAGTWDFEAANRFREISPSAPSRITRTPYWVAKHASIEPTVFTRPAIASRSNCTACHSDAATGRFDDQEINVPKE